MLSISAMTMRNVPTLKVKDILMLNWYRKWIRGKACTWIFSGMRMDFCNVMLMKDMSAVSTSATETDIESFTECTLSVMFIRGASSSDIWSLYFSPLLVPVFVIDNLLSVSTVVHLSDSAMAVPHVILLSSLCASSVRKICGATI